MMIILARSACTSALLSRHDTLNRTVWTSLRRAPAALHHSKSLAFPFTAHACCMCAHRRRYTHVLDVISSFITLHALWLAVCAPLPRPPPPTHTPMQVARSLAWAVGACSITCREHAESAE
jgi:hypothetical protein